MDAHQCPRCELRFVSRPELEEHLRDEHPPPPEPDEDEAERDTPPAT